jgi:hypothetical protein
MALEVYMLPARAILFTEAHSGLQCDFKLWQMLLKFLSNGGSQVLFFLR